MRKDNDQRTEELRSGHLPRLLFAYALPAVVGTMVNALYNVVDRIFIGQGVSEFAISGLAITFPIMIFLQAFGMLVGAGASVRVSILLGRGDKDGAEQTLSNAIMLTLILSAASIIPCYIFMEPLLRFFGAGDRTLPFATDYLKIIVPGNIFATLSFSYNAVVRASGYPKKAMMQMLVGAGLNVILDAVFIFGLKMGIKGAAWATVISMFATMIYVMRHFTDKHSIVRFRRSAMKPSRKIIRAILVIGMAPFAMQLVGSLANVLLNRSFVLYGGDTEHTDLAIGVYGILNSYAMLIVMLVLGVAQGMQPIVGFNYGAQRLDRVMKTYKLCWVLNSIITSSGAILMLSVPEILIRLFTKSEEMVSMGIPAMRIVFIGFLFVGFQITTTQFLQSLGFAQRAMFLSLTRQVLFLIPLLIALPLLFGMKGIWASMPVSDILSAGVAVLMISYTSKRYFRHSNISLNT